MLITKYFKMARLLLHSKSFGTIVKSFITKALEYKAALS